MSMKTEPTRDRLVWDALEAYRAKVRQWLATMERGDAVSESEVARADAELDTCVANALSWRT